MNPVRVEPLGEAALLIRLGERIDADLNRDALALGAWLAASALPGLRDIAPAYASVCVRYEIDAWTDPAGQQSAYDRLVERLQALIGTSPTGAGEQAFPASVEIPVCYGGEFGPDLEAVAAHVRLAPDEVVARHARAGYCVAMLGFMPGFPYLLGLDASLETPRRASPRTRVPAGSVAIGGAQTGIYPRELPGGWQLIGRTPLALFDPGRAQPALLQPGQRVCFRAIGADEFTALSP